MYHVFMCEHFDQQVFIWNFKAVDEYDSLQRNEC